MDSDACADADIPEGAMRAVEIDGRGVLLARVGGVCHAVDATCPHAGAPLAEGVLRDGIVTCPWHKAAFRIDTGAMLDPPAVDDLACHAVRVADGRVRVRLAPAPAPLARRPRDDARCFAIVGSGAAGAMAAQTLRQRGFGGRVVLIGREDRLPYDRTLLSKYTLSGQQGGEKTPLQDAAFYDALRIERRLGEVMALDAGARTLSFADGSRLTYDAALLATGGVPRRLQTPGADLAGVHLLRGPDDADAILNTARHARQAVVIGAGYIGLEVAGSLRERGLEVTVVAPQAEPLNSPLGQQVGRAFRTLHERQGVVFRMGEEVAALEGDGSVARVRLYSGTVLPAELVVAGLGITPATGMLRGVELGEHGAVDVDAGMRAADGLFAAGDIAAFPLRGVGPRIRVEHWRVAQQHGQVAARGMLGEAARFEAAPYFWTIHYRKRLDYVGHASKWDEVVVDGDLGEPDFCAYYVTGGQVQAVAGFNRDQQMAAAVGLLSERGGWTVPELRAALP